MTIARVKKCVHEWSPLITAVPPTEPDARLAFGFALSMSHLAGYDRCGKCRRLSWITNSRARRRTLVSCDTTHIEKRAADFDQWAKTQ
jgi:hypothetical protein